MAKNGGNEIGINRKLGFAEVILDVVNYETTDRASSISNNHIDVNLGDINQCKSVKKIHVYICKYFNFFIYQNHLKFRIIGKRSYKTILFYK